jgi:hypothetical protein
MDFSGGISAFVLPMMRRQSPEVTAFTLPLSHPDAAMIAAILQSKGKKHVLAVFTRIKFTRYYSTFLDS